MSRRYVPARREVRVVQYGPDPVVVDLLDSMHTVVGSTLAGGSGAVRVGMGSRDFRGHGPALQRFVSAAQVTLRGLRKGRPAGYPSTQDPAPVASTSLLEPLIWAQTQ